MELMPLRCETKKTTLKLELLFGFPASDNKRAVTTWTHERLAAQQDVADYFLSLLTAKKSLITFKYLKKPCLQTWRVSEDYIGANRLQ